MDEKNRDKKITFKASTAHFFTAVCFLFSSAVLLLLGENMTIGILFLCLGNLYMITGLDARKKEQKGEEDHGENHPEDL